MMGAGKSRTGPPLAKALSYGFVDVDAVIEQLIGKSIAAFFNQEGEAGFRDVESKVLQAIGERHSLVVATGGGLVTRTENWGVLHQGIVIWIDPGRDRLLNRLQADSAQRPLLQTKDPVSVFDELLAARQSLYAEADLHVSVGDETPDKVAQIISERLLSILRVPDGLDVQQTIGE